MKRALAGVLLGALLAPLGCSDDCTEGGCTGGALVRGAIASSSADVELCVPGGCSTLHVELGTCAYDDSPNVELCIVEGDAGTYDLELVVRVPEPVDGDRYTVHATDAGGGTLADWDGTATYKNSQGCGACGSAELAF